MAKGRSIDLTPIPGKLYRNSHCDICNTHTEVVKIKQHPTTKENVIICADCWKNMNKESMKNK